MYPTYQFVMYCEVKNNHILEDLGIFLVLYDINKTTRYFDNYDFVCKPVLKFVRTL